MWLFWLFVAVPIVEIALFIQVGGLIGLWPTLAIVVLTALVGTALMRSQGAHALAEIQRSFSEMRDPTRPLAHGVMILIAGPFMDNTSSTMVPAIAVCALLAFATAAASLPRLRLGLN